MVSKTMGGVKRFDPQRAYIADGLTSSVTADLSRIRDALIVPVSTAVAYRDKAVPVKQIGQELGVHFVLQGSVMADGNKLRINAQLADAQSGAQKWTEIFQGDLTDLFVLQDQVTARIGNSIGNQMVILAARDSQTRESGAKVADMLLRADALFWLRLDVPEVSAHYILQFLAGWQSRDT